MSVSWPRYCSVTAGSSSDRRRCEGRLADQRERLRARSPAENTRRGRRVPRPFDAPSAANLAADRVLLLLESALVGAGDMAAVQRRHGTLLAAHLAVLAVERPSLASADFALPVFPIDAAILVVQPIVDLIASRVVPLPRRFGKGATSHNDGTGEDDGGQPDRLHHNHVVLLASWIRAIGKPRSPLTLSYGVSPRLVPAKTGCCNLPAGCAYKSSLPRKTVSPSHIVSEPLSARVIAGDMHWDQASQGRNPPPAFFLRPAGSHAGGVAA